MDPDPAARQISVDADGAAAPGADRPSPRLVAPTLRRQVLVVDADPASRALIAGALGGVYQVTTAASGSDALSRIRAGRRHDVILCAAAATVGGAPLVEVLAKEAPDQAARVAVLSGGTTTAASARVLTAMAGRVLWQPFDTRTLTAFVGAFLDQLARGMPMRERACRASTFA